MFLQCSLKQSVSASRLVPESSAELSCFLLVRHEMKLPHIDLDLDRYEHVLIGNA